MLKADLKIYITKIGILKFLIQNVSFFLVFRKKNVTLKPSSRKNEILQFVVCLKPAFWSKHAKNRRFINFIPRNRLKSWCWKYKFSKNFSIKILVFRTEISKFRLLTWKSFWYENFKFSGNCYMSWIDL